MHRFYTEGPDIGEELKLNSEDTHHALHVLRLKVGDTAEVFAGGIRYLCVFTRMDADGARLRKLQELPSTEPRLRVTLFQGLPKADKMDWIVQKATELGVHSIVPLRMERSVSRPDEKDGKRKAERWRRIAREAGKQARRCMIPEVADPVSPEALADWVRPLEAAIVPWEEAGAEGPEAASKAEGPEGMGTKALGPLRWSAAHPELKSLGILIGPEGGIAPREIARLTALGFEPITLGRRILRTETAGLACLSAILSLYGEMEG